MAALGVAIALAAIVAVLAAEQSWQDTMRRSYDRLGANLITITVPISRRPGTNWPRYETKRVELTADDADAIRRECPAVDLVGVLHGPKPIEVKAGRDYASLNVYQASPEWLAIRGWSKTPNPEGVRSGGEGCWISPVAAHHLLGDEFRQTLPASVRVAGRMMPLEGVINVPASTDNGAEGYFFLPSSTDLKVLAGASVNILATSDRLVTAAAQIDAVLGERLGAKRPLRFAGGPWRMQEDAVAARARLRVFTGVSLICILGVAVLGVTNMLLVNLEERTREIAVRRALGAQASRVAAEELSESALICLMGGAAGFGLGYLVLQIAGKWLFGGIAALPFLDRRLIDSLRPLPGFEVHLSWEVLLIGTAACLGASLAAGWIPASAAARLHPSHGLVAASPRRRLVGRLLTAIQVATGLCAAIVLLAMYAGLGRQSASVMRHLGKVDALELHSLRDSRQLRDVRDAKRARDTAHQRFAEITRSSAALRFLAARCRRIGSMRVIARVGNGDWYAKRGAETADMHLIGVRDGIGNERRGEDARLMQGRPIAVADNQARSRVCVIGDEVSRQLFGAEDSLGEKIRVQGVSYTVVGVMAPQTWRYSRQPGEEIALGPDRDVVLPIDSIPVGWQVTRVLVFRLHDPSRFAAAETVVTDALREWLREPSLTPNLNNRAELAAQINASARGLSLRAVLIGSAGLWIALIGIVNMLSASLYARTREIGLLRALGAPRTSIVLASVGEAIAVAAVGAGVGLGVAAGLSAVLGRVVDTPIAIPADWAGIVTGFVLLTSSLAALLPAVQAASVPPSVALRHE